MGPAAKIAERFVPEHALIHEATRMSAIDAAGATGTNPPPPRVARSMTRPWIARFIAGALASSSACEAVAPPVSAPLPEPPPAPQPEPLPTPQPVVALAAPPPAPAPEPPTRFDLVEMEDHATPCGELGSIYFAEFTTDGRGFIALYDSGDQCIWRVRGDRLVGARRIPSGLPEYEEYGKFDYPRDIAFGRERKWGVVFREDELPAIYRPGTDKRPRRLRADPTGDGIIAGDVIAFTGYYSNMGDNTPPELWSLRTRKQLDLDLDLGRSSQLALRPDGGAIALVSSIEVAVQDVRTGADLLPVTHYSWDAIALAFTSAGSRLLVVDDQAGVTAFDLPSAADSQPPARVRLGPAELRSAWFAPGSDAILAASGDKLYVHHLGPTGLSGGVVPGVSLDDDTTSLFFHVAFSPNGALAAVPDGDTVQIVDLTTGRAIAEADRGECRGEHLAVTDAGLLAVHDSFGVCVGRPDPRRRCPPNRSDRDELMRPLGARDQC